jgi:hypothetical protein
MKDVRDAMVDVWRQSSRFRVSDEVHMVEIQVFSAWGVDVRGALMCTAQ